MANFLRADDESSVRYLVRRVLASVEHTVHVTQDGSEALEHFQSHSVSVDLFVTDVDMPQLDGVSLAQEALKLKPSLGIVLMSGFSDQLDRATGLNALRLASISKPFTLEQIKQKVRSIIS